MSHLILRAVKDGVRSITEIINYFDNADIHEMTPEKIRGCTWDLIDRGKLELSQDRKLRIPEDAQD